jgi:membrane protease YdiL (CAAX protease family)
MIANPARTCRRGSIERLAPGPDEGGKLLGGLAAVFAVFQMLAHVLGSNRGEAGLLIAGAVIAALIAIECLLFRQSPASAMRRLGLGHPAASGLIVTLGLSILLLAVIPTYAYLRGASISAYPAWGWLIPGLFAQGGIAEEALFRGYLFRHLRQGRSFWRAAGLATLPFAFVHLSLFWAPPWPVALASLLLATIISFPSLSCSNSAATPSGRRRCCTPSCRARSSCWTFPATRRCRSYGWRRAQRSPISPSPSERAMCAASRDRAALAIVAVRYAG